MKTQKKSDYFLGIDIGTNSIGYAAVTPEYDLVKYHQQPVWGVQLFDEAKQSAERRSFRTARRRIARRRQRIQLLRELFAPFIGAVDPAFFQRIDNSAVKRDSGMVPYAVFADADYSDRDYYKQYPTIHHLITDLMDSPVPHDIRLLYVACAWLITHRGHFFSDVAKEKVDEIISFSAVYSELENFLTDQNIHLSWSYSEINNNEIGNILKSNNTRSDKHKKLTELLQVKKSKKGEADPVSDNPNTLDEYELLRMLCGLETKIKNLFPFSEYEDLKLSLDSDDEKIAEVLSELDDNDSALILILKKIFDWSVLADIIGNGKNLSSAKVQIYEKHKTDLKKLKTLVRKYLSKDDYNEIFRPAEKDNYVKYSGSRKNGGIKVKKTDCENFYKYIKGKIEKIQPASEDDFNILEQIRQDIALGNFLPKQVTSDNRTIPYQLYWNELSNLLTTASAYFPFLQEHDEDNLTIREKILSIMEFRIPYFVGPLNPHSRFAWLKRKANGRILPWNFDKMVDLDASEEEFIHRMINSYTYLPAEPALPKQSMLYERFEVLNIINNICILGEPVSVSCKQKIFELFFKHKKISKKTIVNFLISNNFYSGITAENVSGIDDSVVSPLESHNLFHPFIKENRLTYADAEKIIHKGACTEDKRRFRDYLQKNFPQLNDAEIRKISSRKIQGFGRLSEKFLTGLLCEDPQNGNTSSILNMMWNYNFNLQQLLSGKFHFAKMVAEAKHEFYAEKSQSLHERLDEMYISNAVKRPIIRTMSIIQEVTRTLGHAPAKIFVEMARDVTGENKGKRTISRLVQLKNIYQQIADEDARRLCSELEKYDENALQKDTLYLYFMQMGRDMYSEDPITDLSLYNKEHIYPQSKVKDDSILNNIVLVRSEENAKKRDTYPLDPAIRKRMTPFWSILRDRGLISPEKYFRLTRSTPFSDDEKWGFINRQLVETRQSTKVVTELLKDYFPNSEVVYVKAGLISDFRHENDLIKSRTVNDLHHGKDAYLNAVVGNVYHECFTRKWFEENSDDYSIKTKTLFQNKQKNHLGTIVWNGQESIEKIKKHMRRNYLHLTSYSFCQHGGLFDQNPLAAAPGLIPLKKDKPVEIYGGYQKAAISFFIFALTEEKGQKIKKELTLVPVRLMIADRFLHDEDFAIEYTRNFIDPTGKKNITIQFPLGLKPIKIKTIFEVDKGLRFRLNGSSSGGSKLVISLFSPLLLNSKWENYIKRLESFGEKRKKNSNLIYAREYDKFTQEDNLELYDLLQEKLRSGMYKPRPANPCNTLQNGRASFIALEPAEQAKLLLDLVGSFGTGSGNGIDLKQIGGVSKAGMTTLSSKLSNWKSSFTTARIIHTDSSGLHEVPSINLLELI